MLRPFKFFEQHRDFVVIASSAQPQGARRYLEPGSSLRMACLSQAQTEQMVDDRLERLAAAAYLLFEEHSDVIVNRKSSSHIMMLGRKAS